MEDVLPRVRLSEAAVSAWAATCRAAARSGLITLPVPDEDAYVDGDALVIHVPGTELRLEVPSGHWAWDH